MKRHNRKTVTAKQRDSGLDTLELVSGPGAIKIEAADASGERKLPRFTMTAYTGGAMRLGGWIHPVVVDLAGLSIPSQSLPIRFGHNADVGVGHTDSITVADSAVFATGVISRDTEAAREVVASSANGFPWQASLGASADEREFVERGKTAQANGKTFEGPVHIVRKATLGEISFVDLGADMKTTAKVAASKESQEMDENEVQNGDQATKADKKDSTTPVVASTSFGGGTAIEEARRENMRRMKIEALIAEAMQVNGINDIRFIDAMEKIQVEAVANRWTVEQVQAAIDKETLTRLREARNLPGGQGRTPPLIATNEMLAASLLMSLGVKEDTLAADRDFGERVVTAARRKHRDISLHSIFAAALQADGISAPHNGESLYRAVVEHHVRAGFSTVDLPGILGTVGNKLLLNAFTDTPVVYERVAQQADFNNFLTYTNYRLDHTGAFSQIGQDGEIKSGKLAETTSTNKLETSGQMLTLTRQQVVNDDLNALNQLYGNLGRKARLAVEKALITLVMESSDVFYTAAKGNRLTSSALAIDTLAAAEAAMMSMVDAQGDPIYAAPAILLVPPGLKYLGDMIFTSAMVSADSTSSGTAKQKPTDNPFRGRFRVETSPYLALASLAGYSATTWYLLANPMYLPAFQVAYLQGRRQPTIETSDAAFNTLGIQMRCYFDFGVARVDYRGAIKSTA